MSTPNGDNVFLHELELNVRMELTLAETNQREEGSDDEPTGERLPNPAAQRYEIRLRTLLGAVEALEEGTGSGDLSPQPEMLPEGIAAEHRPHEPDPGPQAEGR